MTSETPAKRRCPRCRCHRVQWSHAAGGENLWRFLGVGFFRCKGCSHRFAGFRAWGQKQQRLMILVGGVLCAVLFIWLAIVYMDPGRPPE